MKKLSKFIVKQYKLIFFTFVILSVLSIFSSLLVDVSFSMQDYMPDDSEAMQNVSEMNEEFEEPIPNLRIALEDVSIPQVMQYKEKLSDLETVKLVMWLDTFTNPYTPIELLDSSLTEEYYKDSNALLQVAVESQNSKAALDEIKSITEYDAHYEGALVEESSAQNSVDSEISSIVAFVGPIILLILILSVKSWIEPVILLLSIGVAIILNMGSNIIFSEVSFITQSVAGILQLAVSLDYAIFLLHEYRHQKEKIEDDDHALVNAIEISAGAVISSAMTTVFGFLALVFMRFGLGKDLGLVLAKGIGFSLISVVFFLPALIKMLRKVIVKTEHRDFLPNFRPLSKFLVDSRWIIIIILVIVPIAFLGQLRNEFTYGMGAYETGSVEQMDEHFINDTFGKNMQIALLVPKGDIVKESDMIEELKKFPSITSVQSYSEQVGQMLPSEIPPSAALDSLFSDKYSRIVLNSTTETEGKEAFDFVNRLKEKVGEYYEDYKLIGEPIIMEEMARIIDKDNSLVNLLAIISIAIVIMINFKSISLPILLVLTIEASIWINLAIPYFTGTNLSFIGYLVISSIQLGATVDYAILYTNNYLEYRKTMDKKEALITTGAKVYGSLIPPSLILTVTGFILSITSSISIVSELGRVLGRGALLSLVMVMVLLPILLYYFDSIVAKTTYKSNFKKG